MRKLWHKCLLVNLTKFFRTRFNKEHLQWMLLEIYRCVFCSLSKICDVQKQPPRCFVRKGVLRNFSKFTAKHTCVRVAAWNFIKKTLWHRCFLVNFSKFLRTYFLQNTSGKLLLEQAQGSL